MKKKGYDFSLLPMDIGRVVCACFPLVFRLKRVTPTGERYKARVRGGAIVAANHTSFLDPLTVAVTFWYRRMYFCKLRNHHDQRRYGHRCRQR